MIKKRAQGRQKQEPETGYPGFLISEWLEMEFGYPEFRVLGVQSSEFSEFPVSEFLHVEFGLHIGNEPGKVLS